MIIVKLIGGLGNQLFQYAAGRRLAEFRGVELKLDLASFETYRLHKYSLHPFNIREQFASPAEVVRLNWRARKGASRLVFRALQTMKPHSRRNVFFEEGLKPYESAILRTPRDVYLDGYWQSEKYFKDIEVLIRQEFTVRVEPDSQSCRVAEEIQRVESVGVHVRRGDFAWNAETMKFHGLAGPEYYRRAVSEIAKRVKNVHLFFFSDDPKWVEANLRFDLPATYVGHNDASKNYEDLRLMSLCRHDITANSSFSWWAAWLNANPGKIVIAPTRWLESENINTTDVIPALWIRL